MDYKIVQKTTPNKNGRNRWKPDMIVSHITEGSYAGAVSWLQNPKSGASSHFVVSRAGEITQLVPLTEMAWINGTSLTPTDSRYYGHSKLKLVRDRKTNANYYTIGIEHEGFYNQGGKMTDAQLKATIWLHKHIIKEVKRLFGIDIPIDREHIVGHFEVTPKWKPNCGRTFDYNAIINGIKGEGGEKLTVKVLGQLREIDGYIKDGVSYVNIDGKYLPLRELAEGIGLTVGWDNTNKVVLLS